MNFVLQYLVYVALAILFGLGAFCWMMILVRRARASALAQLPRGVLLALSICAVVAAGWAQKGDSRAPARSPTVPGDTSGSSTRSDEESRAWIQTNLCFSAIAAHTNSVRLDLAWSDGFFSGGERLDIFVTTNFSSSAALLPAQGSWGAGWYWCAEQVVAAGSTNASLTVEVAGGEALPPALFFKAVLRTRPTDLRDSDGDGIPDLYEWFNGGGLNPYVADSERALRRVVDGANTSLAVALAASAPYDIVELDATQVHKVDGLGCRLPPHPVMITSSGGYAVVRSSQLCAFLLDAPTRGDTVFANLYLHLVAESGFQAGFWVGGNLPWSGTSASATFRNVYVRMPNPDVLYYGWHFYRANESMCEINGCTLNAAGADRAWGVYAYESPPIMVTNCSFVNFPSAANANAAYGVGVLSSQANYGSMAPGTSVSISRCVFDDSFTNAVPYGRAEQGGNVFRLEVADCLLPRAFVAEPPPNSVTNLQTGTGQLTWSGVPRTGSMAVTLEYGALLPYLDVGTQDMDGDGISDDDEINIYGTDPWLADSDWDGVDDHQEIFVDLTDPTNPHSFVQTLVVSVTNTVQLIGTTNYVAWGYSATGWETNGLEVVTGAYGTITYTNATSSGAVYVKVYRDLNTNGVYDVDWDILLVESIPHRSFARIAFAFGDVDRDGVADHVERAEGTDPYGAGNFRIRTSLRLSNLDHVDGVTNYVVLAESLVGWTNLCAVGAFTDAWSYSIDEVISGGALRVLCWRDFNGDGVYDSAYDVLYDGFNLTSTDNGQEREFSVGDNDKDGVQDSFELGEGTNPRYNGSYCFNFSATFTDIFRTTNALTAEVCLGTNRWAGPFVMETNTWTYADHVAVSNGETAVVYFWDDANSNGVRDVAEVTSTNYIYAVGHASVITKSLPYGVFDQDNDNLPDWWEVTHGLSVTNSLDAYLDFDGDGILNGQEYIIGTDPSYSQGTNNLFYALNHSIDDRILGSLHTNRVELFVDVMYNGYKTNFISNTNFWLYGVDLSCSHIWSEYPVAYTNPFTPTSWRLTLIGSREVVYASHVDYYDNTHGWTMPDDRTYWFRGKSGTIYRRTLVARAGVGCDISVGLLDEPIPTNDVSPAVYFPTNFYRFIGNLRYIPQFFIDENSRAYVMSYEGVDLNAPNSIRYGKNYKIGNRMEYYKPGGIYSGSSSPQFMIIGNKPVLIGTLWKATGGSVFAPFHLKAIEKKIHDLEGTNSFRVGTVELDGFMEVP